MDLSKDRKIRQELRNWDTFGVTPTLNGFVIHKGEHLDTDHAFVATGVGEIQDFVEVWANLKIRKKDDQDDGEDDS